MPIDISAIRKGLEKAGKADIKFDISQPDFFLDSGNYALNRIMLGQYAAGIPNRRTLMLQGPSGTGKSLILANLAAKAQAAGYFVFYIDTEDAFSEEAFTRIGMDLSENAFMPTRLRTFEDAALMFSEIFKKTKQTDKVFVAVDSLANLDTRDAEEKFDKKGELVNDMGLKTKKGKRLLRDVNLGCSDRDMFVAYSNHVYANQNVKNGKGAYIGQGGDAWTYIPSITVELRKGKLEDDEDKTKTKGIIIKAKVIKTRFTQPLQKVQIEVPYDEGINPCSGLTEMLVADGILTKNGAWYSYDINGVSGKFQGAAAITDHVHNLINTEVIEAVAEREESEEK